MADRNRVVPDQVAQTVEHYVNQAHRDAAQYDNVTLLDDGQVFSLHALAAEIYAAGFEAGERVTETRARGRERRERKAAE